MKLSFLITGLFFLNVTYCQNVGIGTTTPTDKLEVRGSTTDDGVLITVGNADGSHKLGLFGGRLNDPNPFIIWKAGDPLRFATDLTGFNELMRIMPNGNVGIGTTNPTLAKLHVQGMVGNTVAMFSDMATLQGISLVADYPGVFFNSYWNNGLRSMSASGYSSYLNNDQTTGDFTINVAADANTTANGLITVPERMRITHLGNVGIGTDNPFARLQVADSNVLFTGPAAVPLTTSSFPPASGAGSRMMWYPQKAAFRVGSVNGTQWDKDSIGLYSFASGYNTKSIGEYSTSMGVQTIASGYSSTSMGAGTTASGFYSTSMGVNTSASGVNSTSMGGNTHASGQNSTSMGFLNYATGNYSTSMGAGTTASGNYSTSMGNNTNASGYYSTSMGLESNAIGFYSTGMGWRTTASGQGSSSMGYESIASGDFSTSTGFSTKAKAYASFTIGMYNNEDDIPNPAFEVSTDRIFQIGNGSFSSRRNAITVLRNGNTGIGNNNPTRPLSFPALLGEKILLYPGGTGEAGIGVYSNEMRIHSDYAAAKISFGYQDNAGNFTQTMWLNNTTSVLTVGGTAYPSDERFKKQITAIRNPLQKLMNLNGVEYFMRKEEFPEMNFNNNKQTGLIAQEVEKVMPSAVYEINDKGYKGVDYAKLVPLLIEAIKEQQKQIDEQRKMIENILKK